MKNEIGSFVVGFMLALTLAACAPSMTGQPSVSAPWIRNGDCLNVSVPVTSDAYDIEVALKDNNGIAAGSMTIQNQTGSENVTVKICTDSNASTGNYIPHIKLKDSTGARAKRYIYNPEYSSVNYTAATTINNEPLNNEDSGIALSSSIICNPSAEGTAAIPVDLGRISPYVEYVGMVDKTRSYYVVTIPAYGAGMGQEIFVIVHNQTDNVNLHVYRDDSTFTNQTCTQTLPDTNGYLGCTASATGTTGVEYDKKIYFAVDGSTSAAGACFKILVFEQYF